MNKKSVILSTIAASLILLIGITHASFGQDNRIRVIRPQQPDFLQERNFRDHRPLGLAHHNAHPLAVMFWVVKQLDLSDEQMEELKGLRGSMKEEVKALMQARKALRKTVKDPNSTEDDIRASAQEIGEAIEEAAVKMATVRQAFREILTEEQLDKLESIKELVQEIVDVKREARKEILDLLFLDDEE